MRRLINNFMFGQVSEMMSGRLDSDVYGNSCSVLRNFRVHRQGGISRRPPLKKLIEVSGYTSMLRFIVDETHVYAVLLGEGKIAVYDYLNNEIYDSTSDPPLLLPSTGQSGHIWEDITATECADVRYSQYYNDLYVVHPNYPIMRIRYSGGFVISTPQVLVNQDVEPHAIECTFTKNSRTSGSLAFTFCGESHAVSVSSTTTAADIASALALFTWSGFSVQAEGAKLVFTAEDTLGKYQAYDFDSDQFGISPGNIGFSVDYSYSTLDKTEFGLVYAEDDFLPFYLNREVKINDVPTGEYLFASAIKIASEKMFLLVNGNPCEIFASRPFGASQIVYPKRSNDTILDFIQFELVATPVNKVKDEGEIQISVLRDSDDEIVYESTSSAQKLWIPPAQGQITTKQSLSMYRNGYLDGDTWVPANELQIELDPSNPRKIVKLKKQTTDETTYVDYVTLESDVYFETNDTKVDMTKMEWGNGGYETDKYFYAHVNPDQSIRYDAIEVDDAGTYGIKNTYKKTQDQILENKRYFKYENNHYVYVSSPVKSELENYYELTLVFTDLSTKKVYENGECYVFTQTGENLVTKTLYSGAVKYMALGDDIVVSAIPYYTYASVSESDLLEEETTIDRVATSSTGMEFQLASGRNDRLSWIELGDYIMIGTQSDEYRVDSGANAKNVSPVNYTSYGAVKGITAKLGPDIIFLQRGNGLRLLYKDYYGLQNVELSLTNPDITKGEVVQMVGLVTPDPMLFVLMGDGRIVNLCIDRANGVQAYSEWTFTDKPIALCEMMEDSEQILVALMQDKLGRQYIAKFDTDETEHFSDCGYGYVLTGDTSADPNKSYYEKDGNEYELVVPISNPKEEGLYEFGLFNYINEYVSTMTANPFDAVTQDGSVTIGEAKNVSKIVFRCVRTGHIKTWFNEKDKTTTRVPVCCDSSGEYDGELADHSVNVNGGTTRDLMITVESVGDEPITLLAMAYDVRINRNG